MRVLYANDIGLTRNCTVDVHLEFRKVNEYKKNRPNCDKYCSYGTVLIFGPIGLQLL